MSCIPPRHPGLRVTMSGSAPINTLVPLADMLYHGMKPGTLEHIEANGKIHLARIELATFSV